MAAGGRPRPDALLHRSRVAQRQYWRQSPRCRIPQTHHPEDPIVPQRENYTGGQPSLCRSAAPFPLGETRRSPFPPKVVFLALRKDFLALSLGEVRDPLCGRFAGLSASFGVAEYGTFKITQ